MTALDAIFSTMPTGLQSHREFIVQNETGKVVCNLCKINIDSRISEHLKTESHEDNTILFLKEKMPVNLYENLEFVSFRGSDLCCNVCQYKIELCLNNPHETIFNIIVHNSSEAHLCKEIYNSSCQIGETSLVLKSFALVNPFVYENKHMISYKMQPQFRCKACNKNIEYHENEKELMNHFVLHFNSSDHKKYIENISIVDKFEAFCPSGKHNFVVLENSILCTVCNCSIETQIEKLLLHSTKHLSVRQTDAIFPSTSKGNLGNMKEDPVLVPTVSKDTLMTTELNLQVLLDSLPNKLKNTKYITENKEGQVSCLVCRCVIPRSTDNLKAHLLGNRHKKNTQTSSQFENIKPTQQSDLDNQPFDKPNNTKSSKIEELFQFLPQSLQENALFIKTCSYNRLFCSVCNLALSANNKNLQQHLEGSQHVSLLKLFKERKDVKKITEAPSANKDIILSSSSITERINKDFMKRGKHYICRLCRYIVARSYDEQLLIKHTKSHTHKKKLCKVTNKLFDQLKVSDDFIRRNSTFVKTQDEQFYCTLCKCIITSSTEEENLRKSLTSHLTGYRHIQEKRMANFHNDVPYHQSLD